MHDLRRTYASFGAGSGLGLPIIGKVLGHTQAVTTHRYAHLDNDPLRRASETKAGQIAAALEGRSMAEVVPIKGRGLKRATPRKAKNASLRHGTTAREDSVQLTAQSRIRPLIEEAWFFSTQVRGRTAPAGQVLPFPPGGILARLVFVGGLLWHRHYRTTQRMLILMATRFALQASGFRPRLPLRWARRNGRAARSLSWSECENEALVPCS